MSAPVLVVISGPPGAGKTTIAKRIGEACGLPVLDRDDFKDSLFDSLGWSDAAWSKRIGVASWHLLFMTAETCLSAGVSLVCDSNFERTVAADRLCEIQKTTGCEIVEIYCHADPAVLSERFRERWRSGRRHPGHASEELSDDTVFRAAIAKRDFNPIGVGGTLLEVDTNDPDTIDWERIISTVRDALGERHGSEDR